LFIVQVIAVEPRPPLQRVVVPGTPGHVVVAVQVAVGEDAEAGSFLVAEDCGQRILEFLAEAHIHQAGVQWAASHACSGREDHPVGQAPFQSRNQGSPDRLAPRPDTGLFFFILDYQRWYSMWFAYMMDFKYTGQGCPTRLGQLLAKMVQS
jgi:hypothetical protein